MSDILREMAACAEVMQGRIASRMECGAGAIEFLRLAASKPPDFPLGIDPYLGIPVIAREDMDPLEWRVLDQHGEVLQAGEVGFR